MVSAKHQQLCKTELKVDLADGCKAALDLLGDQLDNGNCATIVRVEIGYFHIHRRTGGEDDVENDHRLSNDELTLLFQGMVCCLPHIKTLVVMSYFRSEAMSLPVKALETLFQRAQRLEILFLHQVKFVGAQEDGTGATHDVQLMADTLAQHPALKRVNIHCCDNTPAAVVNDDNNFQNTLAPINLDPFVCALAGLSTMDYLSLDNVPVTQVSMQALSQSPNLKDVSFYNMPDIKSGLPVLMTALRSDKQHDDLKRGSHLRGLRIRHCDLGSHEADLITNMLTYNKSLESLVFYVDSNTSASYSWDETYGASLATALATNASLKRLEVGVGKIQEDSEISIARISPDNVTTFTTALRTPPLKHTEAAQQIAHALETNKSSSLKHLSLGLFDARCNEIYDAYMNPLANMLESNYVLETLLLQGSNCFSVTSPRVTFLLSLNHPSVLGRKGLFQKVMQHETQTLAESTNDDGNIASSSIRNPWIDSVVENKDGDLSILYYLLGKNPNLMASAISC